MVQEIIREAQIETSSNFFSSIGLTPKHLLIYAILIIAFLGVIAFLLWKLIKSIKEKNNPIIQTYKEKVKLCKQHRSKRYYKSFFSPTKNAPIVAQYFWNGKLYRTIVGYYYGHYITSSGNVDILFARNNVKKWLFLPSLKILLVNLKALKKIEYFDRRKKEIKTEEFKLPNKYVQFLDDEIVLTGVASIDVIGEDHLFYFPVLFTSDEDIANLRFYFHESIKEPLLSDQYLNTLNFFINANKKIVDFNPFVKAKQKLGDTNSSLDNTDD